MTWDFNALGALFQQTLDASNGEFYVEDNASIAAHLTADVMGWLDAMGWPGTFTDEAAS